MVAFSKTLKRDNLELLEHAVVAEAEVLKLLRVAATRVVAVVAVVAVAAVLETLAMLQTQEELLLPQHTIAFQLLAVRLIR
jgi:hypothetical protein